MLYFIIIMLAAGISFLWLSGIDAMKDKYPDYNGKDLFDEEGF